MKHQVISMCVLPVIIKEVATHIILYSFNQGTFIVEDPVEVLGIKGTETSVVAKTLNRVGFVISNPSDQQLWISLSIATPEKNYHWIWKKS